MDKKINVICIKWGTEYGPEYVNNLFKELTGILGIMNKPK